jgi:hypothetical protein
VGIIYIKGAEKIKFSRGALSQTNAAGLQKFLEKNAKTYDNEKFLEKSAKTFDGVF